MRGPSFLFALALAAGVLSCTGVSAQTVSRPEAPTTFTHPERGYSVVVPPGAEMRREERQDLMMQSRKGYRITVQSAAHTQGDTPEAMLTRLEQLHLGEEKTWTRKLDGGETVVAGHRAVSATYEGGKTRTQVVIILAGNIDLVLMFFAPSPNYEDLVAEFRWFLDRVTTAGKPSPRTPAETASRQAPPEQAPPPAPEVPASTAQWPQLSEPSLGYRVSYPKGWSSHRLGESAVFFSGPRGSDAFAAELAIQNVNPGRQTDVRNAVAVVLADLKKQLASMPQARLVQEGPYPHLSGGVALPGQQIVTEYAENGKAISQWTVVVPHDPGTSPLVHVFTYRAPKPSFATYRTVAGNVLSSLTLEPRP